MTDEDDIEIRTPEANALTSTIRAEPLTLGIRFFLTKKEGEGKNESILLEINWEDLFRASKAYGNTVKVTGYGRT